MIPMFYNLLNNDEFSGEFYDTYIDIMKNNFSPDTVNAKIDEYVAAYKEATEATNTRFDAEWANYNYDKEVLNLKNFFNERYVYAKRYLDVLYGKTEASEGQTLKLDASRFTYYGNASASYDRASDSYNITTNSIGENSWDIQVQTPKFKIEKGKTYRVSFKASFNKECIMGANINHQVGMSWPSCWTKSNIELSPELSEFTYEFTSSSETASDWQLCFNLGTGVGKYTIKDVSVTEITYNDIPIE